MRWYLKESEQAMEPKVSVTELETENIEVKESEAEEAVAEKTDMQEAYERGFMAGYQAAKEMSESSEEVDLEEGLVQDAIDGIKNVDFYKPFVEVARKSLKAICKKAKGKTAEEVVAEIKDNPVDSLNPVYDKILATATSKESNAMSLMKKNGFNKALMAVIINFCRETGAFLPDYARLGKDSARKIMDHFENTAPKFWDEFFKDQKNSKMLQMAIA